MDEMERCRVSFDPYNESPENLSQTLINICTALGKKGVELAQARANYEALDDFTKTVLAQNYGKDQCFPNVKERENHALCSEEYRTHCEARDAARHLFLKAQYEYKAFETKFEALRTIISLRKHEMNSIGSGS
jgi:hypothetical protein